MPNLIVGDTTDRTVRLWVRGDDRYRAAEITLRSSAPAARPLLKVKPLWDETDYTGVVTFEGLTAATKYEVTVRFFTSTEGDAYVRGRFETLPEFPSDSPPPFSFVLASCNLSVVSISDLVARLLTMGGAAAAHRSLSLPPERWKFPASDTGKRVAGVLMKLLLMASGWLVRETTGAKQPAPPYLRSPFLKLAAVFDSWVLELTDLASTPGVGTLVLGPAARGVVACSVTQLPIRGKLAEDEDPGMVPPRWQLVLTQVEGTFKRNDVLTAADETVVGTIRKASMGKPWYAPPAFFIHAGDQIYYDFPFEDRRPDKRAYRLAYREAWFDDDAARHVLSHWPHYMTLDDHEIADQFARDFTPPPLPETSPATKYLEEATVAYREYVHSRNPASNGSDTGPFWYTFSKGPTQFFVLDTRTQRKNDAGAGAGGEMIDPPQLERLLAWMLEHRDALKFVVTSVPFVAEVNDAQKNAAPDWYDAGEARPRNPANDKWSAAQFKAQRDRIIEFIGTEQLERVVFLTGDMHCCYHASMRIFKPSHNEPPVRAQSKYESIIVHELGAGPINQLMLADFEEFHARRRARAGAFVYEIVLDRFHTQVNAVMHLKVAYEERDDVRSKSPDPRVLAPEIEWNVIRTLADASAWDSWWAKTDDPKDPPTRPGELAMTGRISFTRRRTRQELVKWPEVARG